MPIKAKLIGLPCQFKPEFIEQAVGKTGVLEDKRTWSGDEFTVLTLDEPIDGYLKSIVVGPEDVEILEEG